MPEQKPETRSISFYSSDELEQQKQMRVAGLTMFQKRGQSLN